MISLLLAGPDGKPLPLTVNLYPPFAEPSAKSILKIYNKISIGMSSSSISAYPRDPSKITG